MMAGRKNRSSLLLPGKPTLRATALSGSTDAYRGRAAAGARDSLFGQYFPSHVSKAIFGPEAGTAMLICDRNSTTYSLKLISLAQPLTQ